MNHYLLVVSSPEGDLYRGHVKMLIVRGSEGDLAVLAGHIPFVTAIREGRCVIEDENGKRVEGTIGKGILTVRKDRVTVLTTKLKLDE